MRISDWSSDVCSSDLKGSHEPALTTERFPCHCNNSRAGAFAARHAGQASPSTRHAERRQITAINPPTMMSGQAEPVRPTNPAAARTPTFDATSLREHSNALAMFTFSRRKRQSSDRTKRFRTKERKVLVLGQGVTIRYNIGGSR